MVARLTFATRDQIQAYAVARGLPNATSVNPTTAETYTTEQVAQADLRGNDYITRRFYDAFKPEFQAETLDALPEDVRCALQDAVSIAAIRELAEPNVFSLISSPASARQLKRTAGGTEFFKAENASTSVESARNQQAHDADIHHLLDRYLLVPDNPANQPNTCPLGGGLGFGIGGCK
ncbi:MAG: hypothetical protein K0U66_04195 [Gammaproteobacteria bacterium]|nr:hypothetical protein [Gammaproteobacteria bacterium]